MIIVQYNKVSLRELRCTSLTNFSLKTINKISNNRLKAVDILLLYIIRLKNSLGSNNSLKWDKKVSLV